MKPAAQCEAAAKKANSVLGQMFRAFHFRTKKVMVKLYKCFVRPHLENAVCAWNPWLGKDIDLLENVQKRFVKMLSDVRGNTYEEKLKDADLTMLEERRRRGDLIQTFKTMRGLSRVDKKKWFQVREDERSARRNMGLNEPGKNSHRDHHFRSDLYVLPQQG